MWGHDYFGSTFWGGDYFGPSGGAPASQGGGSGGGLYQGLFPRTGPVRDMPVHTDKELLGMVKEDINRAGGKFFRRR